MNEGGESVVDKGDLGVIVSRVGRLSHRYRRWSLPNVGRNHLDILSFIVSKDEKKVQHRNMNPVGRV